MLRMKGAVGVAVLAAALSLSGCAAVFDGYDLAPSGLPADEDALRRELAYEPDKAYGSVLEGQRAIPQDDLLRLLYAATAGRYAGAYTESCHLLDLASYLAEDRVTVSVSQQVLSMITSDRALAYTPSRTERLMIHYTAAVGFLQAGHNDAAAVEARRLEALLDRLGEAGDGATVSSDARFFHLFDAAVFEAAGYADAADVAYRRAGIPAPVPGSDAADETGEVLVLVERGFVPHRVEQSVVVVLPAWQVSKLAEGDAAEKTAAAAEAAARILLAASSGGRSPYYHDYGWRSETRLDPWDCRYGCNRNDDDDSDPYLLRISWPVLYQDSPPGGAVHVRKGGPAGAAADSGAGATARLNVADAVRRDFDGERGAMLARTVVRAASKLAFTAGAKSAVSEKDETAGHVVGWLANLGTALTERADTRSWHLLPGSVAMVRLRLPAGSHDLEIEVDGARAATLGPVTVKVGRTTVVTHRVW